MSEHDANQNNRAQFYADLVAAQAAVDAVEKRSTNTFHKYKYASAEDIIAEARVALSENGLAFITTRCKPETRTDSQGVVDTVLRVGYALCHRSGMCEEFEQEVPVMVEKGKPADKAVFGAMTEGLAYMLRGLLLIERVSEATPSARDDRGYQPKPAAAPKQAPAAPVSPASHTAPPSKETDDERAARLLKAIQAAMTEAEIQVAGKEAAGLPKSSILALKNSADKRREELKA